MGRGEELLDVYVIFGGEQPRVGPALVIGRVRDADR